MMAGGNSAARAPDSPAQPGPGTHPATDALPSFSAVYKAYFDFVWSSVRRLGVGEETVDDVVQEVFVIIHSRLHTLQQPDSLRSWVYGVVRRTVSGYHRARRAKDGQGLEVSLLDETFPSIQLTPFELTEQNDQVQLLAKLLDELDDPKREVFVLAEIDEMTVPEIAQALEIPLNTAYSRLRTARQAFEQALARHTAHEKRRAGQA
jgi:RNA polymerase sigma-70 factor, ECF subfamily